MLEESKSLFWDMSTQPGEFLLGRRICTLSPMIRGWGSD